MNGPDEVPVAELVAQLNMKEFDPTKERHRPLLIVKAVDPGCTLELQIEDCQTGEVIRLTSTDDPVFDEAFMVTFLTKAFLKAWRKQ